MPDSNPLFSPFVCGERESTRVPLPPGSDNSVPPPNALGIPLFDANKPAGFLDPVVAAGNAYLLGILDDKRVSKVMHLARTGDHLRRGAVDFAAKHING